MEQKEGITIDGPNVSKNIWDTAYDFFSSTFMPSTSHMVSNLRTILLILAGLFLLMTLYKILRKLINYISSLWAES